VSDTVVSDAISAPAALGMIGVGLAFVASAIAISAFDRWMRDKGAASLMTGSRGYAVAFCWLFAFVGAAFAVWGVVELALRLG
jgi:hypothetical protein